MTHAITHSKPQKFAAGLSQVSFDGDSRSRFAVYFCLIVVGETSSRIPRDVQALAPEIPWAAINGLRNRLVHGHWRIDTRVILRVAQADASTLASAIDRLVEKVK